MSDCDHYWVDVTTADSREGYRFERCIRCDQVKSTACDAWATGEGRMDAVGQNGGEALHYLGTCTDGSPCGTPPEDGDEPYCLNCPEHAEDSDAESATSQAMSMPSKYHVRLKGAWCDVYDVLQAFGVTNPADQHALKKMLMPGKRGHKNGIQDRREAIQSLHRAIELEGEQ